MDKFIQVEGLDRTHTILVMLQELLGYWDSEIAEGFNLHPALHNQKCKEFLLEATEALASLYQEIGAWEEDT